MIGARVTAALAVLVALSGACLGTEALSVRERTVSDYSALRNQPLFSPDRSAPVAFVAPEPEPVVVQPEPPPPPPPPAAAPDWQLVGVVRSARLNSATFTSPAQAAAFTLRTGESRDGWTLKVVDQFEVKLDGEAGRASLRFSDTPSGGPMFMPGEPSQPYSGG